MTGWRLVLMLIALLVPGGSLLLMVWVAARAFKADREAMLRRAQVRVAIAPSVRGVRDRVR